jgi:tetratricopeptide (TPR) repeat protein
MRRRFRICAHAASGHVAVPLAHDRCHRSTVAACPDIELVIAYAEGSLDADARERVEAHVEACETCAALVVHAARELSPPPLVSSIASSIGGSVASDPAPAMPDTIGRYLVVGHIGAGGMGSVWSAIDPRLQRTVAIKLIGHHADRHEARALASLTHPNVVTVFEVGRDPEHGMYIVMELVAGQTLRTFARTSTPARILAAYVDAAHGLAAAHDLGIVHRDFKPDNAIVGTDGRARVLDFGLARTVAPLPTTSSSDDDSVGTREIAGTVPYMAPEQLDGAPADARSDQYSFCVALWEALAGSRPNLAHIDRIPRRLRSALRRGLQRHPADRWPDMRALVDALVSSSRLRPRTAIVGASAIAIVVAAAAFAPTASEPCEPDPTPLARAWDAETAQAVAAQWPTGPTPADDLSRFVDRWLEQRNALCITATRDDAAAACLRQQREQFRVVVELLRTQEGRDFALWDAAQALPDPSICSALHRPRTDPRVDEIRDELARARALRFAERAEQAQPISTRAVANAQALGDGPLVAEALLEHAHVLASARAYDEAAHALENAYHGAEAAALEDLAAEAAAQLVLVVGVSLGNTAGGEAWARHAEAALDRLPANRRDPIAATLHTALGNMLMDNERWDEARRHMEIALELIERVYGPEHPEMVLALNDLGTVTRYSDKAVALAYFERSLEVGLAVYGEEHPDVALAMGNIGAVHENRDEPELALEWFERSRRVAEAVYPANHPKLALAVFNVGIAEEELQRNDVAKASFARALQMWTKPDGTAGPFGGLAHLHLAVLTRAAGELDAARDHYRAALAELEPAWGETHPQCGEAWAGLAELALHAHDAETAVEHASRAVAIFEHGDPHATDLAEARALLTRARTAAGLSPSAPSSTDTLISESSLSRLRGLR